MKYLWATREVLEYFILYHSFLPFNKYFGVIEKIQRKVGYSEIVEFWISLINRKFKVI